MSRCLIYQYLLGFAVDAIQCNPSHAKIFIKCSQTFYMSQWKGVGISSIANTKTRIRVKTVGGARSTSPSLFLLVVVAFACDAELGEEEDAEVTLELLAEEEADVVALTMAGIVEVPETGSVMLPPTTRPAVPSESTVPLIITGG